MVVRVPHCVAGSRAVLEWVTREEASSAERLKSAISHDHVNSLAGILVADTLWEDWLFFIRETGDGGAAVEWASHIAQLIAEGRDGLANWFAQRMPARVDLPIGLALPIKRFRQRFTPWRDPLLRRWEPNPEESEPTRRAIIPTDVVSCFTKLL